MQPDQLRARLEGPIGFPVTPFRDDLSLDIPGLRRNVRALLAHPPASIVAAGGTGELYSLTPAEHREVVSTVVAECAGRVPVIAGVGFNAALAAQLAADSAAAGAHGILAFPPYYPNADDAGLVDYYRAIGDATPLGLLIYSRDWFHPGPGILERLATIPTLVAWKDGQGDLRRLQILMAAIGDRLRWIGGAGDDMVPAYYAAGVRAYTSSVSNVSSRLARRLHDLACARTGAAVSMASAASPAAVAATGDPLDAVMRQLIVPLYAMRARRRGYEVTVMKELMNL
ncbi:MAG TPA: dihydrodipicolinate synthase family protein, partial [Vicinamibacterales bacterium]|nr:dihydrodipicolinate synthase family protein [Vicinamibacterales bacterium]